ncbi:hypothetical protein E4U60_003560 [Claviceps pazoutovae]|uniref:Uncharacterized protein n=1 Tax=Claviceps pazoutovae TaxID=1649127 RepID=A0A9P7M9N7_9HYPO|nr:hypothetical protein E4U60_003560 [Claviceps pazoutovae]
MQFLTLLFASASVAFAAAAAPPPPATSSPTSVVPGPQGLPNWCDHGVESDGTCEKKGLSTYCCSRDQRGEFNIWRDVKPMPEGPVLCKDFGLTYCA